MNVLLFYNKMFMCFFMSEMCLVIWWLSDQWMTQQLFSWLRLIISSLQLQSLINLHIPYRIWRRKFLKVNGLVLHLVNISLVQCWATMFHVIQLSAIIIVKEKLLMAITKVYILAQSFFFLFLYNELDLPEQRWGRWVNKLEKQVIRV